MRIIALDVHRSFAQVAILENGKLRDAGIIDLARNRLLQFATKLKSNDGIVIEATGNTSAIVRLLSPFVGRVVVSNPILVRAIAWAKVKTDKIDAAILAKLNASGFLPEADHNCSARSCPPMMAVTTIIRPDTEKSAATSLSTISIQLLLASRCDIAWLQPRRRKCKAKPRGRRVARLPHNMLRKI